MLVSKLSKCNIYNFMGYIKGIVHWGVNLKHKFGSYHFGARILRESSRHESRCFQKNIFRNIRLPLEGVCCERKT